MSARRCRLCLVEGGFGTSLWGAHAENTHFREKVHLCLGLDIHEDDLLRGVCYRCVYKVEEFYDYAKGVKEAEAKLLEERTNSVDMDASLIVNKRYQEKKPAERRDVRRKNNSSADLFDEDVSICGKVERKHPSQSESDVSLPINRKISSLPKFKQFKPLNASVDLLSTQNFNRPKENNVLNSFEAAFNQIHAENAICDRKVNKQLSKQTIDESLKENACQDDQKCSGPFSFLHSELGTGEQKSLDISKRSFVFRNPTKSVRKSNRNTQPNAMKIESGEPRKNLLPKQNRKMETRLRSKNIFDSPNEECNKLDDSWKIIPEEEDDEIIRRIRIRLHSRQMFD